MANDMIDIEIDDSRYEAIMARVRALMRDASPVTSLILESMWGAVEENFAQQGRPRWLGLKPSTVKRRRGEAGSEKILTRSGHLVSSFSKIHDATMARISTNVVYAAIHQFGGSIQRHPMSGLVRLRKDRNGMLLRQADHPHLAVFAKSGHKRVKVVKWTRTQGWTIKIPARPFLVLTEADNVEIELDVSAYLRRLFDA
ncbi:phage virion morphogenesis protein [Burkholderia cepacia]|uniref:phage virion morphogenesis protein n=1 Tax=Burkholderia cepacia TaxID=292 RepID=UPI001CF578AB|nr:phage virion morphogenesis protein [Burkholderia cepacia]MCA8058127.1 phage virion morphogenesis protein [Burkholderia cepacia]